VRVSGRPSNIVQEAASFDIDAGQWTSFANQRAVFPFSGSIPEQWTNKPMPNPNSLKFIGVTGTLAGIRLVGTLRRFCVDIVSVTFLGPAPPAYTTQGKYSSSHTLTRTDFLHSINTNSEGEAKGGNKLRRQAHPNQESSQLNFWGPTPYLGAISVYLVA